MLGENRAPDTDTAIEHPLPPEPLPSDPRQFWTVGALPEEGRLAIHVQRAGGALAKRLGKFPFWRGRGVFLDFLDRAYTDASAKAEDLLGGT